MILGRCKKIVFVALVLANTSRGDVREPDQFPAYSSNALKSRGKTQSRTNPPPLKQTTKRLNQFPTTSKTIIQQ